MNRRLAEATAPIEAATPVVVVCLSCRLVYGAWTEAERAADYADVHDARHHSAYQEAFTVPGPDVPRFLGGVVVRSAGDVAMLWPDLYWVELVTVGGDAA